MRVVIALLIAVSCLVCFSIRAADSVVFLDVKGAAKTDIKGKDITKLTVKCTLPKKLKDYDFDQVDIFLALSHLDVHGVIFYDRPNVPEKLLNSNVITVDLVKDDGSSDFADAGGNLYGIGDLTTVPQKKKLSEITAKVFIKTFKKTGGGTSKTRWNKATESWDSDFIPDFSAGTTLCEGTLKVSLDKLTGMVDDRGILSIQFPDESWTGSSEKISGGVGDQRQFTSAFVSNDNIKVTALAIDSTLLKEQYPNPYESVRKDICYAYEAHDDNPDDIIKIGWTSFMKEEAYRTAAGYEGYKPEDYLIKWSPAKVAGLDGEKGILTTQDGKRAVYLTFQAPYIIIVFGEYKSKYYDDKKFQERDLPEGKVKPIEDMVEKIAASVKIIKGTPGKGSKEFSPAGQSAAVAKTEAPKEEAAPAVKAPEQEAVKEAAPASEEPAKVQGKSGFKTGGEVQVLWESKWYPAKVLKTENGKYFVHYDNFEDSWDEWVGDDRIKGK